MHLYEMAPEENLPWHVRDLDPDFRSELTKEQNAPGKSLLDLGTGLGSQAGEMAAMGFEVTGTEISEAAVRRAKEKHADVTFLVDDVRKTTISKPFDFVTDRGCFHVLEASEHAAYISSVKRLLKPKGTFLLKVFSSEMGRADVGPIRFSLPALHYIFSTQFELLKVKRSVFQTSTPAAPLAWFLVMKGKDE